MIDWFHLPPPPCKRCARALGGFSLLPPKPYVVTLYSWRASGALSLCQMLKSYGRGAPPRPCQNRRQIRLNPVQNLDTWSWSWEWDPDRSRESSRAPIHTGPAPALLVTTLPPCATLCAVYIYRTTLLSDGRLRRVSDPHVALTALPRHSHESCPQRVANGNATRTICTPAPVAGRTGAPRLEDEDPPGWRLTRPSPPRRRL